tara:strand:+ start:634 stop:897 length:264 start_codon:yes stop_codon:yes gene_type:complete
MIKNKTNVFMVVLVLLVVVLGVVVVYSFVAKPLITGYNVQKYNQGANDVLILLVNEVQSQGFVQIPVGNQTLVLVPYQAPELSQPNL